MNYKKTLIVFITGLIVWFILYYIYAVSIWWLIIPIVYLKVSVIYGSANIQSNFFTKATCSADSNKKEIAISFDDGPNKEFTTKILSTLDEYNVKATFFVIGKNINGNEDLIKKMDANGHTIGNHSFSHSFFIDFKSTKAFIEEIITTISLVAGITGKNMRLFRPPYGVTTPAIANAVKLLNIAVIGWNVRSLDTTKNTQETITKRVIRQIKPGAIILFHDTSLKTNIVLENLLEYVIQNGFKIVPIETLLTIKAYN